MQAEVIINIVLTMILLGLVAYMLWNEDNEDPKEKTPSPLTTAQANLLKEQASLLRTQGDNLKNLTDAQIKHLEERGNDKEILTAYKSKGAAKVKL